jgi:hypothetical protein
MATILSTEEVTKRLLACCFDCLTSSAHTGSVTVPLFVCQVSTVSASLYHAYVFILKANVQFGPQAGQDERLE